MSEKKSMKRDDGAAPDWVIAPRQVDYEAAERAMRERVAAIQSGEATEQVWLLEHPPLYTAGTSAQPADLLQPQLLPVHHTGRGGQYTYHGPGQRVVYLMLDLSRRTPDLRAYVNTLQDWIIAVLAEFGVRGECRAGRVGVWVRREAGGSVVEEKIAAIGIRVSRWVTYHGLSLNVSPDLSHYAGIVPCGLSGYGVTSLAQLGIGPAMSEVDAVLAQTYKHYF